MTSIPSSSLLVPPPRPPPLQTTTTRARALSASAASKVTKRPRSSSIVSVQEIEENYDDQLDISSLNNHNSQWVNYKGAWLIHVFFLLVGKVLLDIIPGMPQDTSWTILNLSYLAVTYLVFHYVTGVPFDLTNNSGVYDRLTLWEQIDAGAQYTPAKKWLTTLPIALFLLSTHYTKFESHPAFFTLNLTALILVGLAPKLPYFHRLRFKFFDAGTTPEPSAPPTPIEEMMGERDFGPIEE